MNHADKNLGSMGSMKNTVYFGQFTSLGIVVAFVANVTPTHYVDAEDSKIV